MNLEKQKALIKYEDYKNVLSNKLYTRHEMNRIQRKDHDIRSYRKYKLKDGSIRFSHFL